MNNSRLNMLFDFLEKEPDDPFIIYAIGTEYIEEKPDKALEYFEKLLNEHEDYVATYYHAGKLYESFANYEKALNVYKTGIEKAYNQRESKLYNELKSAYNELVDEEFDEDNTDYDEE